MADKLRKYPVSLLVFEGDLKRKACEISDCLMKNGITAEVNENISIAAIKHLANAKSLVDSPNRHLIQAENGWILFNPGELNLIPLSGERDQVISGARKIAKLEKYKLFIHSTEGYVVDCLCFNVNRPEIPLMRNSISRRSGWV